MTQAQGVKLADAVDYDSICRQIFEQLRTAYAHDIPRRLKIAAIVLGAIEDGRIRRHLVKNLERRIGCPFGWLVDGLHVLDTWLPEQLQVLSEYASHHGEECIFTFRHLRELCRVEHPEARWVMVREVERGQWSATRTRYWMNAYVYGEINVAKTAARQEPANPGLVARRLALPNSPGESVPETLGPELLDLPDLKELFDAASRDRSRPA